MRKHYIVLLSLVMVTFTTCRPIEKRISGTYWMDSCKEYKASVKLDTDHHFYLKIFDTTICYIGTRGKWKRTGRSLLLNSDTSRNYFPKLVLLGTNTDMSDSISIYVCWYGDRDLEGGSTIHPITGANVKIKTQQEWLSKETDQKGRVILMNQFIDSIWVSADGMHSVYESLGRKSMMPIRIGMYKEHMDKIPLRNEKWRIKRNRIRGVIKQTPIVFKKGQPCVD